MVIVFRLLLFHVRAIFVWCASDSYRAIFAFALLIRQVMLIFAWLPKVASRVRNAAEFPLFFKNV